MSRKIKDRAIEICESDDYQEARNEEFDTQFRDFLKEYLPTPQGRFRHDKKIEPIIEDDIQGFIDSFTFPDENEWCMEKACNEVDDYYEAKFEEEKDRKIGL